MKIKVKIRYAIGNAVRYHDHGDGTATAEAVTFRVEQSRFTEATMRNACPADCIFKGWHLATDVVEIDTAAIMEHGILLETVTE